MFKQLIKTVAFYSLLACHITLSMDKKTCETYCKRINNLTHGVPQHIIFDNRDFRSVIKTFKANENTVKPICDTIKYYIDNCYQVMLCPHIFDEQDVNEKTVIDTIYADCKKVLRVKSSFNLSYQNFIYFKDNDSTAKIIQLINHDTADYINNVVGRYGTFDEGFVKCAIGLKYGPAIFKTAEVIAIKFEE